jgi:threonine synthase
MHSKTTRLPTITTAITITITVTTTMITIMTNSTTKLPSTPLEALLTGYAPDGGLYVPERMPALEGSELHDWQSLSFQVHVLTFVIVQPFL